MKKTIVITGVVIGAIFLVLLLTFKSIQNDLLLSAVGLSWETDAVKITYRMQEVSQSTKANIFTVMAFPVANYSINASGGVLPVWGALVQSILWGLILFPLIRALSRSRNK